MADHTDILEAIYSAVDEVNQLLPPGQQLARSEDTQIMGDGAALDSLGFLNLVMAAEMRISDAVGPVSLSERLLDGSSEPPRTLGDLAALATALQEA